MTVVGTEFSCPHCGRTWKVTSGKVGFVKSAVNNHVSSCASRSPSERRSCNERDEAIWRRRPPRSIITNNPSHRGLQDE